jgi:hypothetical protein
MIRTNETILAKAYGAWNRPFFLLHVAEGIEVAGSGTRFQHECYRVMSLDRDGTRHSKAFRVLEDAKADFERWTTPIVAIDAA